MINLKKLQKEYELLASKSKYIQKDAKHKWCLFISLTFMAVFIINTVCTLSQPKPYTLIEAKSNNIVLKGYSNNQSKDVIVKINDKNLEKVIRSAVGKTRKNLYSSDLIKIVTLDLNHCDIEDLEGIQYCINIEKINLSFNKLKDISKLQNLTKLNELNLHDNNLTDISALSNLTLLKSLDISCNSVYDITALRNKINLEKLDLYNNKIRSLNDLSTLSKLNELDISKNKIDDFTPINKLKIKVLLKWGNN